MFSVFLNRGWSFWKNGLLIIYVCFFIYSITYYVVIDSLINTVFYKLNNQASFLITYYTFICLSFFCLTIINLFHLKETETNSKYRLNISVLALFCMSIIELLFIYPVITHYSILMNAASRIEVQEAIAPISFPYIKQLITGVLIYQTIYLFSSKTNSQGMMKLLIFPLYTIAMYFLVKLGMRKELLIICIATLLFHSNRINDKKFIMLCVMFVFSLLLLGDLRQPAQDKDSINIINVIGEFFFSHSTLPFVVTKPEIMDDGPIPYLNTLFVFIPKIITGGMPEVSYTLSDFFRDKLIGFDNMGFGFSPLAEAYLCSKDFSWLILSIICVCYALVIKNIFCTNKLISIVLIATLPNFMRVDFRSYFIETLIIILVIAGMAYISRCKIIMNKIL